MRDRLIELLKPHVSGTACLLESGSCKLTSCRDCKARRLADHLLANGVIVKQHGYWKDNCNGTFTCSVCGGKSSKMKYCGNCGAKMNNEVAQCHNCKHWIYFADEKRCMCDTYYTYSERDYFCGRWEK